VSGNPPATCVSTGRGGIALVENWSLSLALGAMVLLPASEVLLRGLYRVGVANAAAIVQHLVLVVGMLGGMVAARENRFLTFGGLQNSLSAGITVWTQRFVAAVTIGVTGWLMNASLEFVWSERAGSLVLAYGIPVWLVQSIMPLGFAAIVLHLAGNGADSVVGRVIVVLVGTLLVLPFNYGLTTLALPFLILIAVAALFGAPMFSVLGGVALALFAGADLPTAAVPLSHYQLASNPSLPAIPLFTLAGYLLAEGGAPKRLVRLFRALFGSIKGGAGLVTVLLAAFFTSFTGASGITILALGGLLMPLLESVSYSRRQALGVITSAPALGTLLPPSLPLLLFAIIARQPIETMFLAGVVPTVILTVLLVALTIWIAPRGAVGQFPGWAEVRAALWAAKWEVALPFFAFVALFSGGVTPVETAALTALYAFAVEVVIYRDLDYRRDLLRVMTECGLLVGGIVLILGMALGFTNYLADAQIPDRATAWVSTTIDSTWVFLLLVNVFLLVVGMVMDIYSAIIVVTPLLIPMGRKFGVDPVHLGIIFLANMELGFLTPPVGVNLFFASYRFGTPLPEVVRAVLPALVVLGVGVLLVTYIPALSTWLPAVLR
jgi:C4-dicarboxylate transporter, DctM subunit